MIDGGLAAFDAVHASTDRFLTSLRALDDDAVGGATLIPPWTRGHVITHVARAADSYCRLLAGAAGGHPDTPQYPSDESRAREIDDGSARPVAALVDDVAAASTAFADAMRALPDHAWSAHVRMRQGELRAPADLPRIRLRELEVHHIDLDVGYGFGDVPPAVAAWVVDDVLGALARRSPVPALAVEATDADLVRELTPGAPRVRGATSDLVAWLTGRSAGAGLVIAGPGEVPPAPIWI